MDVLTKEQRHKNMVHIHCRDTKVEVLFRKALWKNGIRYRKNYKFLPGCPDIVLMKYKIAIFLDGDFWHARGHELKPGEQVASNQAFWMKKLARNVERDIEVNDALLDKGWLVLRFWESDIRKNLDKCINNVLSYI